METLQASSARWNHLRTLASTIAVTLQTISLMSRLLIA